MTLDDAARTFGRKVSEEMKAAAMRGLLSAAKRMCGIIVFKYIPGAKPQPVDRGAFKAAWGSGQEGDGAYYDNVAPHAPFVEYGVRAGASRPGRKMIRAIADWAIRKGIADKQNAIQVAFAIAHSIKARGIASRAVMEAANKGDLDAVVKEELERAMRKLT